MEETKPHLDSEIQPWKIVEIVEHQDFKRKKKTKEAVKLGFDRC